MTYIVIEMQTNGNTTAIVPPASYNDRQQAESAFHTVLASAAVSPVEKHAAIMVAEDGTLVRRECYYHTAEENQDA